MGPVVSVSAAWQSFPEDTVAFLPQQVLYLPRHDSFFWKYTKLTAFSLLNRTHAMIIPPLPDIQNLDIDKRSRVIEKCSKLLEQVSREYLSVLNT
jgi:hypothetical protein